jgi:hypothetical protein
MLPLVVFTSLLPLTGLVESLLEYFRLLPSASLSFRRRSATVCMCWTNIFVFEENMESLGGQCLVCRHPCVDSVRGLGWVVLGSRCRRSQHQHVILAI